VNNKIIKIIFLMAVIAGLSACASTPDSAVPADSATSTPADSGTSEAPQATGGETAAAPTEAPAVAESTTTAAASSEPTTPAVEPEAAMPPRIVESCKDEAYTKYEQQSRESIQKGLDATKEGKYGVGFRDVEEHNKWSKIHNSLFKSVNDACGVLAECAKNHKKDKGTECVAQAKAFDEWQKLAKSFAEQAKTAETVQPPKICSQTPDLSDPARCFHSLADNIDKACNTDECKEASNCWRGVGFLDTAIIQATTSCGFVHQKLSDCRGYIEATSRRETKFNQCKDLQGGLNITVLPVL